MGKNSSVLFQNRTTLKLAGSLLLSLQFACSSDAEKLRAISEISEQWGRNVDSAVFDKADGSFCFEVPPTYMSVAFFLLESTNKPALETVLYSVYGIDLDH